MYLEKHKYRSIALIKLRGSLDSGNSQRARSDLDRLIPRNGRVLLDLTKMSYLSSAGLRVLLLACRRAEAVGAVIALTGLQDEAREVMAATGFLDLFSVTGTVSDGIDALGRKERASARPAPRTGTASTREQTVTESGARPLSGQERK